MWGVVEHSIDVLWTTVYMTRKSRLRVNVPIMSNFSITANENVKKTMIVLTPKDQRWLYFDFEVRF